MPHGGALRGPGSAGFVRGPSGERPGQALCPACRCTRSSCPLPVRPWMATRPPSAGVRPGPQPWSPGACLLRQFSQGAPSGKGIKDAHLTEEGPKAQHIDSPKVVSAKVKSSGFPPWHLSSRSELLPGPRSLRPSTYVKHTHRHIKHTHTDTNTLNNELRCCNSRPASWAGSRAWHVRTQFSGCEGHG